MCWQCSGRKPTSLPNVLLISIDALRADHVGFMGYTLETTPNLDELARQSAVFDCAITQVPSTTSMFTMLTGRELSEIAHSNYLREGLHLDGSTPSLISNFKKNGYRTAAIVNNPHLRKESGLARDFDYYNDFTDEGFWAKKSDTQYEAIAEDLTESAIQWLSENDEYPFFMWVHYLDPHHPYDPPSPYDSLFLSESLDENDEVAVLRNKAVKEQTRFYEETNLGRRQISGEQLSHIVGLYDGEIAYTDKEIGRLLEGLKRFEHFKDTLIIITADHGEEFLDHGGMLHTYTLYDELIHVPLLFHLPAVVPQGKRIGYQARIIDILPTVLDLLGLRYPSAIQGKSLRQAMFEPKGTDYAAVAEVPLFMYAYRTPEYKLIVNHRKKSQLLFNLQDDPGEMNNIFHKMPSKSDEMARLLGVEKRVAKVSKREKRKHTFSRDFKEKMKALGYLQ